MRHADKKFELLFKENEISAIIEDVANREMEIGIIGISNLNERFWIWLLKSKGLEFHETFREQLHVHVGQRNSLYNNKNSDIKNLLEFPFVAHEKDVQNYLIEMKTMELFGNLNRI